MALQRRDVFLDWAKFLDPESLRGNLIAASLFLAAYEILKSAVVDQIRGFFTNGFDQQGDIVDSNYRDKVLALDQNKFGASLLWLKGNDVITEEDFELIGRIRKHRNELAHELPRFITRVDNEINIELLKSICELTTKIDRWWIREVEIPTNPDFDDRDVEVGEIQSGNMIFLGLLIHIASGEATSTFWEDFKRLCGRSH